MDFLCLFVFLFSISTSLAALSNITIDDQIHDTETNSAIIYSPPGAWRAVSSCMGCQATQLNTNNTSNGTWHESLFDNEHSHDNPSASVSFFGSAIYVYCIVANTPNGNSDILFFLDSQLVGTFSHIPTGSPAFIYNVLVFHNESLLHGDHTLIIQNGRTNGPKSLVLLDYIIYSRNDSRAVFIFNNATTTAMTGQPTSAPNSVIHPGAIDPTSKIIGGVLGPISGLLLILVAFLFYRQQKISSSIPTGVRTLHSSRPGEAIRRWWGQCLKIVPTSRFSFNQSPFIIPIVNRNLTHVANPSTPGIHHQATHQPQMAPSRVASYLSPSVLDAHVAFDQSQQPLSITEWQRRTLLEAEAIPPRLDVSDVDLSSYYESDSYHRPPSFHPPPKPTMRRFTVVNN